MAKLPGLAVAGLAFVGLGLVLAIVGLATPGWLVFTATDPNDYYGLFQACINDECLQYGVMSSSGARNTGSSTAFASTKGVLISGVIVAGQALFMGITMIIRFRSGALKCRKWPTITMIISIIGGILIVLAPTIFALQLWDDVTSSLFKLHYSFALSIVGGVLVFVGGIAFHIEMRKVIGASQSENDVQLQNGRMK